MKCAVIIAMFVSSSAVGADAWISVAQADDGKMCAQTEKPDVAIPACGRLMSQERASKEMRATARSNLGLAYFARAIEYKEKSDGRKAIEAYQKGLEHRTLPAKLEWDIAVAYYLRGNEFVSQGKYDAAIADFNEAIKLEPKFDGAYNSRAWSLFKSGRAADALPDIEHALNLAPENAYYMDTHGHILEAFGRKEQAIAQFRKALKIQPDIKESQEGLKRLSGTSAPKKDGTDAAGDCKQTKDLKRTIRGCTQIIARAGKVSSKDRGLAYENRGTAYLNKRDYKRAIADLTKALELNPNAVAYAARSRAYEALGNKEKAKADHDRSFELASSKKGAIPASEVAACEKSCAEAEREMEFFCTEDPELPHSLRAAIIQECRQLMIMDHSVCSLRCRYPAFGGKIRGKNYIRELVKKYTKSQPRKVDVDVLRDCKQHKDGQRRMQACTQVLSQKEWSDEVRSHAYLSRGVIYAKERDNEKAIADFTQAIKLKPNFSAAISARGGAYEQNGNKEAAAAEYRAALKIDPSNQFAKMGLKRLGVTP